MTKFHIYQDQAAQYRWRLVADNGRIIADSAEGYVSKSNIRRAVEIVKAQVAEAENVMEEPTDGEG